MPRSKLSDIYTLWGTNQGMQDTRQLTQQEESRCWRGPALCDCVASGNRPPTYLEFLVDITNVGYGGGGWAGFRVWGSIHDWSSAGAASWEAHGHRLAVTAHWGLAAEEGAGQGACPLRALQAFCRAPGSIATTACRKQLRLLQALKMTIASHLSGINRSTPLCTA